MIIFETERLLVRAYTADDFEDFYRLNSDEEVMRYIRPVKSRKETQDFFQKVLTDYDTLPGLGRWGMYLKTSGEFAGSFAVIPIEHSDKIQLGYALLKVNWGKGYASESTKGGIDYAFAKLGLEEIAGVTYPENTASQQVLLKNGFVLHDTFFEDDQEMHLYMLRRKADY